MLVPEQALLQRGDLDGDLVEPRRVAAALRAAVAEGAHAAQDVLELGVRLQHGAARGELVGPVAAGEGVDLLRLAEELPRLRLEARRDLGERAPDRGLLLGVGPEDVLEPLEIAEADALAPVEARARAQHRERL